MEKLKMHSKDLSQDNLAKIQAAFPNCVTERKNAQGQIELAIDFDLLRQELSANIVEGPQERYRLDWPGKREAMLTANAPIAKTLRPAREESVNFDDTENLFIEGDNLDALKLLQETYLGKVKMIYIDPPYNTGKDFIYEDDFTETSIDFLRRSNQEDEDGNRLIANTEQNGRFHSDWLSMMYPRLYLARNLLSDDGVIFVSIDDNESSNLRKILDEIFGELNLLSIHHIQVRYGNKSLNERKDFQELLETTYIYAKNKQNIKINKPKEPYAIDKFCLNIKHNETPDETIIKNGREMNVWHKGSFEFEKTAPHIEGFKETWISGSILTGTGHGSMYTRMIDDRLEVDGLGSLYRIHGIGEDGLGYRYYTNPTSAGASRGKMYTKIPTVKKEEIISGTAEKESPIVNFYDYSADFGNIRHEGGVPFNAGKKPIRLIKQFINYLETDNFIAMDFFAGSASTAHAIISANASDGGSRKFILVQLPEEINSSDKNALNLCEELGFPSTIAELSKERIRRAGAQILEGDCHEDWNKDIGFRVLKVDTSNMQDVYYQPQQLNQNDLFASVDNIKSDRSSEDLLFQVLLDWGVDLTLPIRRESIQGKEVFIVDDNALVACFEQGISEELIHELAALNPLRAVFRDNGFASDAVKVNVTQIFKQRSPITEVKAI